ncbi:MAG: hypothetical protein HRT67_08910 [Flavobacteriaceae bacterium]|nr:hypothetical protein [Flavobacteriaceae bacterium]
MTLNFCRIYILYLKPLGDTLTIYIRFAPGENAVGTSSGIVTFSSNQAAIITKFLLGVGVSIAPMITVSQNALQFDTTEIKESFAS